jgi:hypothetical protein
MEQSKKGMFGKWNDAYLDNAIGWFIGLSVFFYVVAAIFPTLLGGLGNLSVLNIPLASLFSTSGVIPLIIMATLVIFVVKTARGKK